MEMVGRGHYHDALDPAAVIRGCGLLQRKLTIAPHIAGRKFLI
jgi:hypothetical protein